MKNLRLSSLIILTILLAACQPPAPAIPSATATPTFPPPTVTATPIPVPSINLPLSWPVPPLTETQISEARGCDIEALASQRYPESTGLNELSAIYTPDSACDWAVLAYVCAQKSPEESAPADSCLLAFTETLARNPALVFRNQIFQNYLGATSIVQAPPIAQKQLAKIFVRYEWNGLGDRVRFTIAISRLTGNAIVNVDPNSPITHATEEIKSLAQALPSALTDLLPINSPIMAQFCTDNYPSWGASLTFEDDSVISLTTSDSNLLGRGGPWQTVIDGQQYVQFSTAFSDALDTLIQALGLTYGEPAAMTCNANEDILNLAFP